MNFQVDVMIVGDSKVGHEILDKIASSKSTIKVAFISKAFKSSTTHDYLNVEYFRNEVEFTDYKNRLFCCYLKDGRRIYATHLIIATGLDYSPLMLANGKPAAVGVYNNIDDVPKTAKNQPAVVVCNTIEENWQTPVLMDSPNRFHPFRHSLKSDVIYSGAPYIITTDNYNFYNDFYTDMLSKIEDKKEFILKYGNILNMDSLTQELANINEVTYGVQFFRSFFKKLTLLFEEKIKFPLKWEF